MDGAGPAAVEGAGPEGRRRGHVEHGGRALDPGLAERVEDGRGGDAQGPLLADIGKALVEGKGV